MDVFTIYGHVNLFTNLIVDDFTIYGHINLFTNLNMNNFNIYGHINLFTSPYMDVFTIYSHIDLFIIHSILLSDSSSSSQSLQTSTHSFADENSKISSHVSSMAELVLPHAGKRVSKRFIETSK